MLHAPQMFEQLQVFGHRWFEHGRQRATNGILQRENIPTGIAFEIVHKTHVQVIQYLRIVVLGVRRTKRRVQYR